MEDIGLAHKLELWTGISKNRVFKDTRLLEVEMWLFSSGLSFLPSFLWFLFVFYFFCLLKVCSPCQITTTYNSWTHILTSSPLEIKVHMPLTYLKLLRRSLIGIIYISGACSCTVISNLCWTGKFKSQKRKMLGKPSKEMSITLD